MAESDGSWPSYSAFMWHARGSQVPIKSRPKWDTLGRGTPKRKTSQRPASQQATKKKKKQISRWTWGCWLSVEPPCKRPPEPWPLKDAIPPSPANGSRFAAQKLPVAGTADRGCDGAEASIRPGGDAALLLAAYGARTHCGSGSSSEQHEAADITREPRPNVMRIAEPKTAFPACTSSSVGRFRATSSPSNTPRLPSRLRGQALNRAEPN